MKKKEATEITGGLSAPSKMPGPAYSTPAAACKVGSKLAQVSGTVCSKCYALKGRYSFPSVAAAQRRRLESLDDPRWVDAMVTLIGTEPYFRWHDAGDLQSAAHLRRILEVVRLTPGTKHWLPTREKSMVREVQRDPDVFPPNITIRVSATMIDGAPPLGFANTSTVTSDEATVTCPSHKQGNLCGPCRACWDPETKNIVYRKH